MKLFHTNKCDLYDFGEGHPFRGERFSRFIEYLKERNISLLEICKPTVEATEEHLLLVHTPEYIEKIKRISRTGHGSFSIDTLGFPHAYEASLAVVSNTLSAGNAALTEKRAVAMCGGLHHAMPSAGEGFCIVNDVAILARWLQKEHDVQKIFIFDYDAHHGNGTMHIFYDDPNVLFLSIHQDPHTLYPGEGFPYQVGSGDAEGTKCNIPLPPYASDKSYEYAIKELVIPLIETFNPDFIIANGGADECENDRLTELALSKYGLHTLIGHTLHTLSEHYPLAVLVASGYKPEKILFEYWEWLLRGIAGEKLEGKIKEDPVFPVAKKYIDSVKKIMQKYWDI